MEWSATLLCMFVDRMIGVAILVFAKSLVAWKATETGRYCFVHVRCVAWLVVLDTDSSEL